MVFNTLLMEYSEVHLFRCELHALREGVAVYISITYSYMTSSVFVHIGYFILIYSTLIYEFNDYELNGYLS